MDKVIFYYSPSGNTKSICLRIQNHFPEYRLIDIRKEKITKLDDFNIIGFASGTYYLDLPFYFKNYIADFEAVSMKTVFVISTYAAMPGRIIKTFETLLQQTGLELKDFHSVKMPESYPPFRKKGILNEGFPDMKELILLEEFLDRLEKIEIAESKKLKLGFWNRLISPPSLEKIRKDFGSLQVDEVKCISCGICRDHCDYDSICLNPNPEVNSESCQCCYACLNSCPEKAIFTDRILTDFQYQFRDFVPI